MDKDLPSFVPALVFFGLFLAVVLAFPRSF
jgi:hypothetical protein